MTSDPESTPPETPEAKRRRASWWASKSGPPSRHLTAQGVGTFGTLGGLLVVATAAVNPSDARAVLLLAGAWLAYAGALWLARR